MDVKRMYIVDGQTYPIKDELKSLGCSFQAESKSWKTKPLSKMKYFIGD